MTVKNIKIRFNLEKDADRKAYEYITGSGVSYSQCVINLINKNVNSTNNEMLLNKAVNSIKDSMKSLFDSMQYVQAVSDDIDTETEDIIAEFMEFF